MQKGIGILLKQILNEGIFKIDIRFAFEKHFTKGGLSTLTWPCNAKRPELG
jgi:hypothetical protein